jgi:lysine-specific demethylase 3
MGTPATSASYLSKGKRPIRAHVSRPPAGAERSHIQTLANSGIKPSDLNIYTPISERHFEIQEGRCLKVQYAAASRCHVCSSKAARSECLFHGIRAFILQPPPFDGITLETPSFFFSLHKSSRPNLRQLDFNRPVTKREKENLANTVARELVEEIEEAYKHAFLPKVILRPEKECQERICNACKAPFFLRFWFCGDCGRTYCPQCFASLQEEMPARNGPFHSTDPQTAMARPAGDVNQPGGKYTSGGMNNTKRRFIGCSSGRYHEADCFIAVTTESAETLKKILDQMQDVIQCTLPQRELAPVTLGPLQRFSIEDKTVTWDASQPIIITGVSDNLECDWSPSSFARAFRKLDCHVQECLSGVHRSMKVSDFFETFGQYSPQREGARNLMVRFSAADSPWIPVSDAFSEQDWPSNIDLAEWQPDLFQDIMTNIPLPDFTRRNGALNLASRIPPGSNNPVLGPKLYCSQRSQDAKGWGTLKLHVGAADMINIMMHASDYQNKPVSTLPSHVSNSVA